LRPRKKPKTGYGVRYTVTISTPFSPAQLVLHLFRVGYSVSRGSSCWQISAHRGATGGTSASSISINQTLTISQCGFAIFTSTTRLSAAVQTLNPISTRRQVRVREPLRRTQRRALSQSRLIRRSEGLRRKISRHPANHLHTHWSRYQCCRLLPTTIYDRQDAAPCGLRRSTASA
jgi:hypothetical protein